MGPSLTPSPGGAKAIQGRKKTVFSTNGAGITRHPHGKNNSRYSLTPFTRINLIWITDLS